MRNVTEDLRMSNGHLTHLDEQGHATMVDVGGKESTVRTAVAAGEVWMQPATLQRALEVSMPRRRGRPCRGLPQW